MPQPPRPKNRRATPRRARPRLQRLEGRALLTGVPAQWSVRGPGGGGALFSPAINPANVGDLYIASDMGQVFHSTTAGASWSQMDFRKLQGGHEARVQFTEDPNILYAVDYTDLNGGGTTEPTKSTDGGQTWQRLANDPTGGGAIRLFANPANHNVLLLSDYNDLFVSTDGGATWANRYTNANGGQGLHIAGAFFDGSNIYVGVNNGLLVSSNGGASFSVSTATGIPAGKAIMSFSGAKQGATTRFFAVTWDNADVYAGVPGYDYGGIAAGSQGVYTLTLGQPSWTPAMTGITSAVVPIYVATAQNDANTAYVAGGSSDGSAPTVYKTTDAGAHWTSVFQSTNNQNVATGWQGAGGDRAWSYGEVVLGLAVSPTNASQVVITDFGMGHATTDGGASWKQLYVNPADQNPAGSTITKGKAYRDSGLDNTTSWSVNWADANNILIGNSDIIGSHSTDGGQSFAFATSGNTYNSTYMTVTASSGLVYAATSSVHDMYQSTHLTDSSIDGGNGAVLVSATKGATWTTVHNFGKPVVWIATDPTNANRLYASVASSTAGGIYVTNDLQDGASSVWTKLATPPRTQGHANNIRVLNDGTLVVSFSGRRAGSPVNFTDSSGVFVSTDGGTTWADRSAASMHYWTTDVVVDPTVASQNTWYAGVFSGWGGASNGLGGLYRTTDRGVHWTQISNLDRVSSVTVNPADGNEGWLTTETQGLWYSSNMKAATPTFTQVAGYPFRQPERVFYNPYNNNEIWVTSFGGGVSVGSTSTPTKTNPTITWAQPADITYGTALGATQLNAQANVPGTFAYSPAAGTVLHAGANQTLSVTFTPTDASTYNTVVATTKINVGKGSPVLNWFPPASIVYGTPLSATQLNATANVPGTFVYSPAAGTVLHVGANQTLSVTFTPTNTSDYIAMLTQTQISVTPAHLTVTANGATMKPGGPLPALTATITGFVNGDTPAVVSGAPVLTTTATVSSPAGSYPITVALGTLAAADYDFTTANGTLVVSAAVDGDYDGVGRTQPAIFRTATAQWYVLGTSGPHQVVNSKTPNGSFGIPGDIPVPGDYDGVGHAQLAVFRPSTAQWFVLGANGATHQISNPKSTNGSFGQPNMLDIPVPGDYDGVGHTQPAVFRPATAQWFVLGPNGGHQISNPKTTNGSFGLTGMADIPVPGDYDGIGRTQPAVFRRSTAQWFVLGANGGRQIVNPKGTNGAFGQPNLLDIPVPGDYDGVGRTQLAVFRPATAQWFVLGPNGSHPIVNTGVVNGVFGTPNLVDIPASGPAGSLLKLGLIGGVKKAGIRAAAMTSGAEPVVVVDPSTLTAPKRSPWTFLG